MVTIYCSIWNMKSFFVLISFLLSTTAQAEASSQHRKAAILINESDKVFQVVDTGDDAEPPPGWIARMSFKNTIMENGWSTAEITTNVHFNHSMQRYSAGVLEGSVTSELISQHWKNTIGGYCGKPSKFCSRLSDYITTNLKWMLGKIEDNPKDDYWQQVHLALLHVQGLEDGYRNILNVDLSIRLKPFGLLMIQFSGDIEDLETVLNDEKPLKDHLQGPGRCSALIKLLNVAGKKDLLVAQDTWSSLESMLRIIKRYDFGTYSESFSSYPGSSYSGDDFYILSTGLVTLETTNGNSNTTLWKYITPVGTVPEWIRNVVANRLAKSGGEWCQIFSRYNSGTYNNQWMIVDYNQLPDSHQLLYVLEQIPGEIKFADVSNILYHKTYWASYNTPYFPEIYNKSGILPMVKKYGDWFTHDKNPRAKIFARDHSKVTDMKSMIKLMRYNNFKHDPLSACNNCTPPYSAENSIAARCDLNPADGVYPFSALTQRDHAATDMKVTSYTLHKTLQMVAQAGPTYDQQPVFQWSTSPYASKSHEGHPDRFDFLPVLIKWDGEILPK